MENIINVEDLNRSFKVSKRENAGLIYSLKSLFKREYTEVNAVKDINFSIKKGEIRGLIGPNGAGKSTTIKMLSGILYPSSGKVTVMGFTPWLQRQEYVKNIGVVFGQKSQLVWDLPAIDTFQLNRKLYHIPDEIYTKNIEYFKKLLNIEEVLKKPVRQLSLGERMKCELVCALLHEPPLIYLDEPTIGLDIMSKEIIRNFIKRVNQEKQTTFILTTHDLDDIEDLCEKVTIINKGTIVYDGDLENLKSLFSKRKVIDVKFSRQVSPEMLESFKIISKDTQSAKIEVNLEEKNLQDEIYRIFKCLPVHDIDISGIEIEEVIKQIYCDEGRVLTPLTL